MKKLILSLALVGIATIAFAQKKVVRSAERNFKKGELEVALTEVKDALNDPETKDDPNTTLLKAKIQTKMFEADEDNAASTVATGRSAFEDFQKTLKMVDNDKESKIGKEIYQDDIPGALPDNLRPFSMQTLKQASFNKAIAT